MYGKVRVGFAEVDFGRIIFYPNVYLWVQRVIESGYAAAGLSLRRLIQERKIGLPIVESRCAYLSPARYEDVLTIDVRVVDLTPRGFTFTFIVDHDAESRRCFEGQVRHRFVDTHEFEGIDVPEDVITAFAGLNELGEVL